MDTEHPSFHHDQIMTPVQSVRASLETDTGKWMTVRELHYASVWFGYRTLHHDCIPQSETQNALVALVEADLVERATVNQTTRYKWRTE